MGFQSPNLELTHSGQTNGIGQKDLNLAETLFRLGSLRTSFQTCNCRSTKPGKRRTQMKIKSILIMTAAIFSLAPLIYAQCPEICDGNENTALGQSALINNTTGLRNTGLGFQALQNNNNGNGNTAIGFVALLNNTTGHHNTAVGVAALLDNISGESNTAVGFNALRQSTTSAANTALGFQALQNNTVGGPNTAVGYNALTNNEGGGSNMAIGHRALESNTHGGGNTASGAYSLEMNTLGESNTATGVSALRTNTMGDNNSALGDAALFQNTTGKANTGCGHLTLYNNSTGIGNTATGSYALFDNTTGNHNIGLGISAGSKLTNGSDNIDIGSPGRAGESNTIRIGQEDIHTATYISGISGTTVAGGVGVLIDSEGHLGTNTSSVRFKDAIKPMDKASEAILALKPVTFHYKQELDPEGIPQFGLVAEEVEKVNPDLVARDDQGKPYTVRYEAVNAMLLNEFLKEHAKVEHLKKDFESKIAQQQKQIEALTVGLQKVRAQLEASKPAQQVVNNP
jgi:hypothetical protein